MGKGVLQRFAKYNKVVQVLQLPLHLASIRARLFANPATQPARNRAKWPWPRKTLNPRQSQARNLDQHPLKHLSLQFQVPTNTDLGWKMMTGPNWPEAKIAKPSIAKPSLQRILPDFCQAPMHADLVVGSEEFVASQGRPGGGGRWCSVIIQHAIHIDSSCCHDLNTIIHHIHDIWWWWNWVQTKKVNKSQEEPRAIHRKREREGENRHHLSHWVTEGYPRMKKRHTSIVFYHVLSWFNMICCLLFFEDLWSLS